MTRMTGPDCVVMCNLINTYIHTYIQDDKAGLRGYVQFNKYTYIHTYIHRYIHTYIHKYAFDQRFL